MNRAGWCRSTAPRRGAQQWQILEEVLGAKRRRNDRLPIFLFGDERTAEMVPASVLRHANAFMRLFEDSPEFLARVIARAAQLYLERLPPPMFKALMDYTLHAQLLLAYARPRRRRRLPQEPGRPAVLSVLRREHAALRHLGLGRRARLAARPHRRRSPKASAMPRASSAPTKRCSSSAARRPPTRSSGTGWSAAATSCSCDRNCHKSILHSLIMTGATPIYLVPSRNGLGIIGPISREQFTPESIRARRSPPARCAQGDERQGAPHGGHQFDLRRPLLQRRRHQGSRWAIRSTCCTSTRPGTPMRSSTSSTTATTASRPAHPTRSPHAITFATQSTHKLLAAFSQASMIHVQHGEKQQARHGALQRSVHDAHLDLAAVRHHRVLRRRRGDDGAAGRPRARAGDASTRRSASGAR